LLFIHAQKVDLPQLKTFS